MSRYKSFPSNSGYSPYQFTMYINNPYAHAGWPNANPNAVNMGSSGHAPSVFGALPFSGPSSQAAILSFHFVSLTPNILNCIVTGPDAKPYYRISTDYPQGVTAIKVAAGNPVGLIEWKERPVVELPNIIPKQYVSQWLALSPQRDRRSMVVKGNQYIWVPGDNEISLYTSTNPPTLMAKTDKHAHVGIKLEITTTAIHLGLLEPCVAATVLLLSGRRID